MHVLRDCLYAKQVWLNLLSAGYISNFFSYSLLDWISFNVREDCGLHGRQHWHLIWGVTCWFLWNWRNKDFFYDNFDRPSNPTSIILNRWKEFCGETDRETDMGVRSATTSAKWTPPPLNWTKLNVDRWCCGLQ